MSIIGYCYPWDLIGDPGFVERVHRWGIDTIALAGFYHGVRAATPAHPEHRIVHAEHSALYLAADRVRQASWTALRPPLPGSWTEDGAFERARGIAADAGLRVLCWASLTHADGWHSARDETVRDAFGDHRPYALCPQRRNVAAFVAELMTMLAGTGADGAVLECTGALGVDHADLHDKIDGAGWDPLTKGLLSLCFCDACCAAYAAAGHHPERAMALVREHRAGSVDPDAKSLLTELIMIRDAAVAAVQQVAIDAATTGGMGVDAVHFSVRSPTFGAFSPVPPPAGTTAVTADWSRDPAVLTDLQRATAAAPGVELGAYLHAGRDAPAAPPLRDHLRSLRAQGVTSFHLYHLGLVAPDRIDTMINGIRHSR